MTLRDLFTPLNIVLVLLLAAVTASGFAIVPAGTDLPVHWGLAGEADRFLPRDAALLVLPAIAVLTLGLLFAAMRLSRAERRQAARHAVAVTITALLALFVAIQTATVMIGAGLEVDMVRIVVLGLGMLFVVLGNILPKTQPNWIAGFRMPWTVDDPANWQASHRLGGLLMMAGGAAIAIAALVTGNAIALGVVTLLGIALPIAITTIYSLRLRSR